MKYITRLFLCMLLCVTLLYGMAQTGIGKQFLTAQLAQRLSTEKQQIHLSRMQGHVPWNIRMADMRITQQENVALEAQKIKLHFSFWNLLRGRFTLHELQAENITWHRPLLPFSDTPKSATGFAPPLAFPNVAIGKIDFPHIALKKGIVTKDDLTLHASLEGDASRIMSFAGALRVTEGAATALTFRLTPSSRSQFLFNADVEEAQGGLIGGILHIPADQPIQFHAALQGDLASMNGGVNLMLGEETLADITIRTTANQHIMVEGKGSIPAFSPLATQLPSSHWEMTGDVHTANDIWDIQQFTLALPEKESSTSFIALHTQGKYHPLTRTLEALTSTVTIEDIYPFSNQQGKAEANIMLQGTHDNLAITGDAELTTPATRYHLQTSGALQAMDMLALETLTLHRYTEATKTLLAKGALAFSLHDRTLDTTFKGTLPALPAPLAESSGTWNITAKGGLERLPITAKVTLADLSPPASMQHLQLGEKATLTSTLLYQPHLLTIEEATLHAGAVDATLQGAVPLSSRKKASEVTLKISHTTLPTINGTMRFLRTKETLRIPEMMLATTAFQLTGNDIVHHNTGWNGALTLDAPDIAPLAAWAGMKESHGEAHATIALTPESLSLQGNINGVQLTEAEIGIEHVDMQISTPHLRNPQDYTITVDAKNAVWQGLRAETLQTNMQQGAFSVHITGSHQQDAVSVTSTGMLEKNQLRLSTLQGEYGAYPFALAREVTFRTTDTGWEISPFTITSNHAKLMGDAKQTASSIALHANVKDLPLRPFMVDKIPTMGEVTANGTLSVEGSHASPNVTLNATLTAQEMSKLTKAGVSPETLRVQVDSMLKNNRLTSKARLESGKEPLANATLSLPVTLRFAPFAFAVQETQPMEGTLHSEIALSRFNSWLAPLGHRVVANLKSDMRIHGTLANPQFAGDMHIEKLSYTHLTYGLCVREGDIVLALTPSQQLMLRTLDATGDRGRGKITGSGSVDIANRAISLALKATDAAMFCSPMLDSTISGTLATNGTMDALTTKGALTLGKTSILLPSNGASAIPRVEKRYRYQTNNTTTIHSSPIPMRLDIQIDTAKPLFVRGRGLDAEFAGGFHITGEAQKPTIEGKLRSKRGRLALLGSTMTITEGVLEFLNNNPRKPYLQLTGMTKTNNTTITTELAGAITKPKLTLTSSPALPQDEILALLLFGRPLDNITPLQALQLAQAAASLASGESGTGLLGSVRDALGVDSLNIGEGADGNPTVGAGKYITDKVYVGIEQGTTPESRRLSTEIELLPTVTGKTSTNTQGEPSVGLEWRFDY